MPSPTRYMLGTATPSELGAFQEKVRGLQTQLAQATRERNAILVRGGGLPFALTAPQRQQYETLDAQVAALQAELDALTSAAYQPIPTIQDWTTALGTKQAQAVANGDDSAATSSKYRLSDEVLASLTGNGRYSPPDDMKSAFQRALEQSAQAAPEMGTAQPVETGIGTGVTGLDTSGGQGGTGMDLTDPWMLQAIGVPAHVILAAQSGDTTAIPNWVASQNQATEAQTGYDQLALTQAEQLRQQMQQSQIERDVLSGVLGGLAPSGAISPQNIQDYMGEQGVYGDITRAYYNQLTGNPTPWQMQQWQAQQQQVAADNAYRQQALAQQAAYQQAMLEQQRREMAAQIGQAVANMANQSYMDTLGYRLPAGTQYAPGFEPGGTLSQMASMSGLNYNPSKIGVANPPTTDELMRTVQEAIGRF